MVYKQGTTIPPHLHTLQPQGRSTVRKDHECLTALLGNYGTGAGYWKLIVKSWVSHGAQHLCKEHSDTFGK